MARRPKGRRSSRPAQSNLVHRARDQQVTPKWALKKHSANTAAKWENEAALLNPKKKQRQRAGMRASRVLSCGNSMSYAGLKIIENKASQAWLAN